MLLVKHISWHAVFHYWKQICCVIQCYCTFQYRFSRHLVVMQSCCLVSKNQENRVAPSSCYWLDFVEYLPQRKLVTFKQWFETKPSCSAWAFNKLFIKNDARNGVPVEGHPFSLAFSAAVVFSVRITSPLETRPLWLWETFLAADTALPARQAFFPLSAEKENLTEVHKWICKAKNSRCHFSSSRGKPFYLWFKLANANFSAICLLEV